MCFLEQRGIRAISAGVQFYITFDMKGDLALIDESTQGTAVSFDGLRSASRRRHCKWSLFHCGNKETWVHLPDNFDLDLVLAKH